MAVSVYVSPSGLHFTCRNFGACWPLNAGPVFGFVFHVMVQNPLELSASVPQIFPNDPVGMGREGGLVSVEVVPSTGRGE